MANEIAGMEPSGRVLPLFRGEYSDSRVYENPDIVLYKNSSYVAKQATVGNPPPAGALSNDYWQMVARGVTDSDISDSVVNFEGAESLENISSGETVKAAFGKIAKAVSVLVGHYTKKATASILGHVRLSDSAAITTAGEYALDAVEKNASVAGTLANQIAQQNSNLTANNLDKNLGAPMVSRVGGQVNTLKGFVEYVQYADNVKSSAGNIKLTADIFGVGTGWSQFLATWQNYYNQDQYDLGMTVLLNNGELNSLMHRIIINGKNGSYTFVKDTCAKKAAILKLNQSNVSVDNGQLKQIYPIGGSNILTPANQKVQISFTIKLKISGAASVTNKFVSIILYKNTTEITEFIIPIPYISQTEIPYSQISVFSCPVAIADSDTVSLQLGNSLGYTVTPCGAELKWELL